MHEAYTTLFDKDFQYVVNPGNNMSSLASTLIEFIFNIYL